MSESNENLFELGAADTVLSAVAAEAAADAASNSFASDSQPLAARLRPRTLEEYIGQKHLLGEGKLLRRAIEADRFSSIILTGPPGTGKTSLAELVASLTDCAFIRLSGVNSSVSDIRKAVAQAVERKHVLHRRTLLFVDEIHRFSRSQQDSLLPDVENGNIRLIGATTHNPQFYVIGALLSRSLVFQLKPLTEEEIRQLIDQSLAREEAFPGREVAMEDDAKAFLAESCEGDARRALTALELAVLSGKPDENGITHVDKETISESIQKKFVVYGDDGHYDCASAFIKSMRGSDPDAAIHYLARMLQAGEDIRFIARRIVILASEDIGNADPRALPLAVAAMQAIDMIGLPEARLILAQAVTYCATAPKSNASYCAINEALKDVEDNRLKPVPVHLRDPHSSCGKENGNGTGYLYPHDHGGFAVQQYMPDPKSYYRPKQVGYESKIAERMQYWQKIREQAASHE